MAVAWNFENAAHLLRRVAFGGTVEEIQSFLDTHISVADAVDDLVGFSASSKKPPKGGNDYYKANRKQKQWWLKSMLTAKSPRDAAREKMVLYWHGHLCSGFSKVSDPSYIAIQNGLFRRYANGNFRDLVREFNRDPANLIYLDGILNYASNDGVHVGVNENFGREVMELFTLGVTQLAADGTPDPTKPNYTETDVHQLARALSGWVEIDKGVGIWHDYAWDGGQYDDGGGTDHPGDPVVIFGTSNNNFKIGSLDDMPAPANDVLQHILDKLDDDGNHQAAMHLASKLWKWFAYPAPAPGLKALLAGFASTLVSSNYEVAPMLTAMFNSDEFYSNLAKSRTVKNPVDYLVGIFKTLGVRNKGTTIGDSDYLYDMLANMGMEFFEPPNVAGWPGGKRWITTGTLVSRLDFARLLAEADSGSSMLPLDSVVTIGSAAAVPATVVDEIIARVGLDGSQGGVAFTAAQRDALIDFITDGGTKPSLDLSDAFTNDANDFVRGTIALVLQSAEAQIF